MISINPIERCYRDLKKQGKAPLILHSGNPNLQGIHFPKEILQAAYQKAIAEHSYKPEPKGLLTARRAVSEYYARQNCEIHEEKIILSSGTSESFAFLFRMLTANLNDHVLVPIPAYPLFDHIADYTKTQLKYYSLVTKQDCWTMDWENLTQQWNHNTKAFVLISPHNPTGWVAKKSDIQKIVELCDKYNTALICDEVFSNFYFGQENYPRAAQYSQPRLCFTLNGISKMLALPGLKLGWIAVTGKNNLVTKTIDALEIYNDTFLSANGLIQQALPDLLTNATKFLKNYFTQVQDQRELALQMLGKASKIKVYPPEGGFYLMARVHNQSQLSEEEWIIELMKQKGIFVYPGYFYDYASQDIHFIFSFLTKEKTLRQGLDKIIKFSDISKI